MPRTRNGLLYEVHGQGPRTIVLLPGFGCSIDCWSGVIPLLEGHRVVTIDLPGHAGSVGARADGVMAHLGETVFEACDEIGLDDFIVGGLSLGGAIALRVALDHPERVRAVIGIMPWNAGGTILGEDEGVKGFHDAFGNEEAIAAGVAGISQEPERTTDLLRTMPTVTEQMWRGWLGGGVYTSMAEELPSLQVPALYVVGGQDHVVELHKQVEDVRAMPGATLVMLADLGHLGCYEFPDLIAREITDFLERRHPALGRAEAVVQPA